MGSALCYTGPDPVSLNNVRNYASHRNQPSKEKYARESSRLANSSSKTRRSRYSWSRIRATRLFDTKRSAHRYLITFHGFDSNWDGKWQKWHHPHNCPQPHLKNTWTHFCAQPNSARSDSIIRHFASSLIRPLTAFRSICSPSLWYTESPTSGNPPSTLSRG